MELREYQSIAIQRVRDAIFRGKRSILLVAPTGCHAKGQGILMFSGSILPVEEIIVGDLLLGPDSLPRQVIKLCRGFGNMYRVTPTKGNPFIVNDEHILTLIHTVSGDLTDISVKDYLSWNKWKKHTHKLLRCRVEFAERQQLTIDPYFMGLLLGDGCLTHGVAVAKPGKFIVSEMNRQADMHGLKIRTAWRAENNPMHFITKGNCGNGKNSLLEKIRLIGLDGCRAGNKFIPQEYKIASYHDRMDILAGLLDTDGHLSNGGFDYISKSQQLANDVAFVARSVGLAAYVSECKKKCQTGATGTYFRVSISGDCSLIPCRKNKANPRRQKKDVLRTGFTIEPIGHGSYYGFTLTGDGRYLLDDFTVTHNSGKTVCAAHILQNVHRKGNSAIFVAHRRELIKQCSDKLEKFGVPHAIMMAGEPRSLMTEIQVCSIQTFHSRVTKRKTAPPPTADVIIIDEAHRSLSRSYLALKEEYPNAIFIGLTATPCRSDGGGLGSFYEELVEISNPKELIDLGFLVPTRIIAPRLPDLRGLKIKQGDYESEGLGKRMIPMIGDMVADWERYAKDRKTIIFAVNVAHSKHIQEQFSNNGYACEHLDGETPTDRRDEILDNLKTGKTQIVTNCQVLSEGWDEPTVSCAILARPTLSYGLYLQMAGRICRPSEGKKDSLIIDHAGSIYKHGFPQDSGGWELNEETKIDKIKNERLIKEPHPITCMECFTVYTSKEHCPNCGCKPTTQARAIMMEEGRLYEVKREAEKKEMESVLNRPREHTMEQKAHFYGQLKTIASRHGYRQGWIAHKYKERYGVWPNHPSIKRAPMLEPSEDTLNFIRHTQIRYAKRRQPEQRA